jgi:two-component system, NtrC family, sensor kinase
MPSKPSGPLPKWFLVVVAAAVAMGLRTALDPLLEDGVAFVFAFPAVVFAAFYAGVVAGWAVALLSAAWTLIPWLPPSLAPSFAGWMQIGVFLAASAVTALICGRARSFERRMAGGAAADVPAASPGGGLRWLQTLIIVAAVAPTLVFLAVSWESYRQSMSEAEARAERSSRIATLHMARVLEASDTVAAALMQSPAFSDDAALRRQQPGIHERLRRLADRPQIYAVLILDTEGNALASSRLHPVPEGLNLAEREFFAFHRDEKARWYIGPPERSRVTGERFVSLSYRRERADGAFAGVVAVLLAPGYFENFYGEMARAEPDSAVTLIREDGQVISRWPAPSWFTPGVLPENSEVLQAIRRDEREGTLHSRSTLDGVERIMHFVKVERYPLYVATGVARQSVVGAWGRRTALLAAFIFPALCVLVFAGWMAVLRTREQLALSEALAQSAKLEALGRLTGGVAHDFNNLLTVVGNSVHLLRETQPELAHNPQLDAIARTVDTGAGLTRQLLTFARRQALRLEVIRLQERLPPLLQLVRTLVGARIDVRADIDPRVRPIEADVAELELAVINLAANARDAMPDGGQLIVSARNAQPGEVPGMEGDFVLIAVTDTGAGMSAQTREKAFEPFFTTKDAGRGVGLGLSQVYGLCTQAGGTALIDSEPGKGTTVKLYFPARESTALP